MIRIMYSSDPHPELQLDGSNCELSDLRERIVGIEQGEFVLATDQDFDPAPFEQALRQLNVKVTDSLLSIRIAGSDLYLSARKDLLDLFADNLPWDAEQDGYHIHFDRVWYEEGVFAQDSLEIVLSLRR